MHNLKDGKQCTPVFYITNLICHVIQNVNDPFKNDLVIDGDISESILRFGIRMLSKLMGLAM